MKNTPDGIFCSCYGGHPTFDGTADVTFIRYHIEDRALENKVFTNVLYPTAKLGRVYRRAGI